MKWFISMLFGVLGIFMLLMCLSPSRQNPIWAYWILLLTGVMFVCISYKIAVLP